jgi:DNA-binding PadR family transcriptional regulator
MTDIDLPALDRELKNGAAELGTLIERQSRGGLVFHLDSLYPLLSRLEERGWIKGSWWRRRGSAGGASID